MKSILINIFLSIGVGYVIYELQSFLDSDYVIKFLKNDLIAVLITLLAINSATLGIVLTKIRELLDQTGREGAFKHTKREMIQSLNEQFATIVISLLLLLVVESTWLSLHPAYTGVFEVMLIACFVYALLLLNDTVKTVFVLIDYKS